MFDILMQRGHDAWAAQRFPRKLRKRKTHPHPSRAVWVPCAGRTSTASKLGKIHAS